MNATLHHPLVRDYLGRLDVAATRLPQDQALDLTTDIREHLAAALGEQPDEVRVREVLDRLGSPEALVAEAWDGQAPAPSATERRATLEISALVAILVGSAMFILFPLNLLLVGLGVVLLWLSQRWTTGDKVIGTVVLGAGSSLPLLVGLMAFGLSRECVGTADGREVCTGGTPAWVHGLALTGLVLWAGLWLWTVWRLVRRLR